MIKIILASNNKNDILKDIENINSFIKLVKGDIL